MPAPRSQGSDTTASRLRHLFIKNVILPREQIFERLIEN
jgi:hypothetical protein